MTPQEKAKQLVDKMLNVEILNVKDCLGSVGYYEAKECALIACNEVLGYMGADRGYEFWTAVKLEIEKL